MNTSASTRDVTALLAFEGVSLSAGRRDHSSWHAMPGVAKSFLHAGVESYDARGTNRQTVARVCHLTKFVPGLIMRSRRSDQVEPSSGCTCQQSNMPFAHVRMCNGFDKMSKCAILSGWIETLCGRLIRPNQFNGAKSFLNMLVPPTSKLVAWLRQNVKVRMFCPTGLRHYDNTRYGAYKQKVF